jgi:hypothetical protein
MAELPTPAAVPPINKLASLMNFLLDIALEYPFFSINNISLLNLNTGYYKPGYIRI